MEAEIRTANPKRRRSDSLQSSWYPYYAGYSETFARTALSSAEIPKDGWVLDPWNGSGTTTSSAISLGFNTYGYDLNPVMVLVAMARSLDPAEYPSLKPLSASICRSAKSAPEITQDDPLLAWLVPSSVAAARGIEYSIQKLLIDDRKYSPLRSRQIGEVSDLAAFFYIALFRTLRKILGSFLTSNPTWTKKPRSPQARVRPASQDVRSVFREELNEMLPQGQKIEPYTAPGQKVLAVASSDRLPLPAECVACVLASPPYCTRIDYAVATEIELAILGYSLDGEFDDLRRNLIGTTTVPKEYPSAPPQLGTTCLRFLDRLAEHPSKASSTYYLKNHLQYFHSIRASLAEISRVMRPKARCTLVVQDSFYKDLHNDLPKIFVEMAAHQHLELIKRQDFPLSRTMAGINPGANGYRKSFSATESVLSFTKRPA